MLPYLELRSNHMNQKLYPVLVPYYHDFFESCSFDVK